VNAKNSLLGKGIETWSEVGSAVVEHYMIIYIYN
jgi:hypothetical protein